MSDSDKKRIDFCIECRKKTGFILQKRPIARKIRDREYEFWVTTAVCEDCGEEMEIPGLIDRNVHEIDEQYRAVEGLVTIDDIEKLMKIYKIGKAPLSLALGFGEVTITRYLAGQIPSKEYSDILRKALTSPSFMKKMLQKNRAKIADAAYNKSYKAASQLESLFNISGKMRSVICMVFKQLGEVTPLMLQKILYFTQGISFAVQGKAMFTENCEAWVHGPVYPEVYELFRDFKFNPIDDDRFSMLDGKENELTSKECDIIKLVVSTFGVYGGKTLERITHNEAPWETARAGYDEGIPSREPVTKESIKEYFELVDSEYHLDSEEGINKYIHAMLGKSAQTVS